MAQMDMKSGRGGGWTNEDVRSLLVRAIFRVTMIVQGSLAMAATEEVRVADQLMME